MAVAAGCPPLGYTAILVFIITKIIRFFHCLFAEKTQFYIANMFIV